MFQHVTAALTALLQEMNGPFVISIIAVLAALGILWAMMDRHEHAYSILIKYSIYGAIVLAIVGGALGAILGG